MIFEMKSPTKSSWSSRLMERDDVLLGGEIALNERTDETRVKWRNEKRVELNKKKTFLLLLHFTFKCVVFFRSMVCANMMNVLIKLTRSMWKPRSVHRRFPARCRCVQAFLLAAHSWSYAILSYTDAHKTAPHRAYASRVDLDPSTCQHSNPLTRKLSQRDCGFVYGWNGEKKEREKKIKNHPD